MHEAYFTMFALACITLKYAQTRISIIEFVSYISMHALVVAGFLLGC